MPNVQINAQLTEGQAEAFAQFLKRASFSDYCANAVSWDETYLMIEAGDVLRTALAEAGYNPR